MQKPHEHREETFDRRISKDLKKHNWLLNKLRATKKNRKTTALISTPLYLCNNELNKSKQMKPIKHDVTYGNHLKREAVKSIIIKPNSAIKIDKGSASLDANKNVKQKLPVKAMRKSMPLLETSIGPRKNPVGVFLSRQNESYIQYIQTESVDENNNKKSISDLVTQADGIDELRLTSVNNNATESVDDPKIALTKYIIDHI